MLEVVGIGLAGFGAVASGEGVAEADEEGAGVGGGGSRRMERGRGWLRSRDSCWRRVFATGEATSEGEGRQGGRCNTG
jgi:hypothetical protein